MIVIENILHVVQIAFYAIAIYGVYISWKTFKANQNIKRAEWITSFHEKFYEKDTYKEVRKWMDFGILSKELETDEKGEKQEKLAIYLNFFEFIATLEKMNQLSSDEISILFAYYFRLLTKTPVAIKYVNVYQYKNLRNFLQKFYANE